MSNIQIHDDNNITLYKVIVKREVEEYAQLDYLHPTPEEQIKHGICKSWKTAVKYAEQDKHQLETYGYKWMEICLIVEAELQVTINGQIFSNSVYNSLGGIYTDFGGKDSEENIKYEQDLLLRGIWEEIQEMGVRISFEEFYSKVEVKELE